MGDAHLAYRRSRFATRLPTDRLFTPSHYWLADDGEGVLRVGFTTFATRMLGEVVELDFEVADGAEIELGQTIGWLEGFKAVTDLFAPVPGRFAGANPDLDRAIAEIYRAPYEGGWLYRVEGTPPDDGMDATGYAAFLDSTIDRMTGNAP